jgi:hypothetical protein
LLMHRQQLEYDLAVACEEDQRCHISDTDTLFRVHSCVRQNIKSWWFAIGLLQLPTHQKLSSLPTGEASA